MKKTIYLLLALIVTFAFSACNCGEEKKQEAESTHDGHHEAAVKPTASTGSFGVVITAEEAIAASELPGLLDCKEMLEIKLVGNVESVCQMSGCWVDVEIGDSEIVHVTFLDDGYVWPKDAKGKSAIIEGVATFEEIPVEMLKHLAKDEGKSQEEIDSITEPGMEYTFVAKGVILQENI